MIPKIIHYCWFGKTEKPAKAVKCINSWKKFCPDYEIIEWNESNFNMDQNSYLRWCYDNKKWAFLTDLARLLIVNQYGGFYFDTDVEVVKNLDSLLSYQAVYGFENDDYINTGEGFASIPNHKTVISMINQYEKLSINEDGSYNLIGCPHLNTKALNEFGLVHNGERQTVCGAQIFPTEYFNPYDDPTGRLNKTKNTYSIHWYSKSWLDKKAIIRSNLTKPFHRIFGNDCFKRH